MVSFKLQNFAADVPTVILRERSPRRDRRSWTLAILRTCAVRLPHIAFHGVGEILPGFRRRPGTMAWPPSLPSVPTSRATRVDFGKANERSWSTMVLMASFNCRNFAARTSTVIFFGQIAVGHRDGHFGDVSKPGR